MVVEGEMDLRGVGRVRWYIWEIGVYSERVLEWVRGYRVGVGDR